MYLHQRSVRVLSCHSIHRERRWYCRRWAYRTDGDDNGAMFLHLRLFHPNLCLYPTLGDWLYPDSRKFKSKVPESLILTIVIGRMYDGSTNIPDQLELHWRHSSFICRYGFYTIFLQRRIRSHRVSGPDLHGDSRLTITFSGMFLYATINGLIGITVRISGGRLEPSGYDLKEYWTWKGRGRKPWFVRVLRNLGRKGKADDESSTHTFHINGGSEAFERFEHDQKGPEAQQSVAVPLRTLSRYPK